MERKQFDVVNIKLDSSSSGDVRPALIVQNDGELKNGLQQYSTYIEDKIPVYNWEDAVKFIHERCNLSEDMIIEVLQLEEEYMKTIGVITEEEEPDLWVIDGMQRMEGKIDLDNPSQRNPVQWGTVDDLQRMSKAMEEFKNGNKF